MSKRERAGLIFERLEPGSFVVSDQPGGFTDTATEIHVNGVKVEVEPHTRRILSVTELALPIQIPTHRRVRERKNPNDPRSEIIEKEIGFCEKDQNGQTIVEGLEAALSTGAIRKMDDEDVERHFPEIWKARFERSVWTAPGSTKAAPMAELISQAEQRQFEERQHRATLGADRPVKK